MSELTQAVTDIAKLLWSAGVTSPVDYIEQLGLLMALHELRDLPEPLCWPAWRSLDEPAMLATVRDQVVPAALTRLNGQSALFQDMVFLVARPETLARIVAKIDALPWAAGRADLLGDVFECLLAQMQEAGVHGQFRTPGHIARFLVEGLAPEPGETVWDPACGTGTLLLEAVRCCAGVQLRGDEIDRRMTRLAILNMYCHGLPLGAITFGDTLAWALEDAGPHFPVIVTNPPFGGTVPMRLIPQTGRPNSKSEVQFLAAVLQRLAIGGRAGIIVPYGLLFSGQFAALRRHLLETCQVLVVDLPQHIFEPHTAVATAALFIRKTGPAEQVRFFQVRADGLTLDKKRRPGAQNDLPQALAWLQHPQDGPQAWSVNTAQVLAEGDCNLQPARWAPVEDVECDLPAPEEILADLWRMETELLAPLAELSQLTGLAIAPTEAGIVPLLQALHTAAGSDAGAVETQIVEWLRTHIPTALLQRALIRDTDAL